MLLDPIRRAIARWRGEADPEISVEHIPERDRWLRIPDEGKRYFIGEEFYRIEIKRPGADPEEWRIKRTDDGEWYVDSYWRYPRARLLCDTDAFGNIGAAEPTDLVREVMRERYGIDLVERPLTAGLRRVETICEDC